MTQETSLTDKGFCKDGNNPATCPICAEKRDTELTQEQREFGLTVDEYLESLPKYDDAVDCTQCELIGSGGSHDVYFDSDSPSHVYKVKHVYIARAISTEITPEIRQVAQGIVDRENARYAKLYEYFPAENCLREESRIQSTRIEQEAGEYYSIEALVNVQEKSDAFDNPTKLDCTGMYIETSSALHEDMDWPPFERLNQALFGDAEFDLEDYLNFDHEDQTMRSTFERVQRDPELAGVIKDFLGRFKKFYEEVGDILDLVGDENMIAFQEDGQWNYQLGSMLKGSTRERFEQGLTLLERNPMALAHHEELKSNVLNGLAVGRYVNALAAILGMERVIDITLTDQQIRNLKDVWAADHQPEGDHNEQEQRPEQEMYADVASGKEAIISRVTESLAQSGMRPQMVLISGYAGAGKTYTSEQLQRDFEAQGLRAIFIETDLYGEPGADVMFSQDDLEQQQAAWELGEDFEYFNTMSGQRETITGNVDVVIVGGINSRKNTMVDLPARDTSVFVDSPFLDRLATKGLRDHIIHADNPEQAIEVFMDEVSGASDNDLLSHLLNQEKRLKRFKDSAQMVIINQPDGLEATITFENDKVIFTAQHEGKSYRSQRELPAKRRQLIDQIIEINLVEDSK